METTELLNQVELLETAGLCWLDELDRAYDIGDIGQINKATRVYLSLRDKYFRVIDELENRYEPTEYDELEPDLDWVH